MDELTDKVGYDTTWHGRASIWTGWSTKRDNRINKSN